MILLMKHTYVHAHLHKHVGQIHFHTEYAYIFISTSTHTSCTCIFIYVYVYLHIHSRIMYIYVRTSSSTRHEQFKYERCQVYYTKVEGSVEEGRTNSSISVPASKGFHTSHISFSYVPSYISPVQGKQQNFVETTRSQKCKTSYFTREVEAKERVQDNI